MPGSKKWPQPIDCAQTTTATWKQASRGTQSPQDSAEPCYDCLSATIWCRSELRLGCSPPPRQKKPLPRKMPSPVASDDNYEEKRRVSMPDTTIASKHSKNTPQRPAAFA